MADHDNDIKLLRSYLDGDERAFAMIVEKHEKTLMNFFYRMTRDRETSSDLCQETFLRFIKAAKELRGESSLGTWLYRVAYNIFIDHARRKEPQKVEIEKVSIGSGPKAEKNLEGGELREKVMGSIARLPKEQGAAVYLFYFEEMDLREIAKVLSASEGKVKTLLFRGRENLRELLG